MDIKKIISEMTLEEKASLCSGKNFWETQEVERLGVPSIMMTDGPHGLRKITGGPSSASRISIPSTCYPTAVLTASSFDRDLLSEMGQAIGEEAVSEGVSVVLGPGVNIKRSPLCGRNFEYFSEDPYLSGEMAVSFINGVQSKGVGTSLKHFAANEQETRRWSSDSQIDERTLREIYFAPFKKAVEEARPATVMCSYNKLNGEYASENHRLLTEILRDEWGFDGLVVSDWGAVNDRVKGLAAGLELEMPGVAEPSNDTYIVEAVRNGTLPMETLDLAVERILKLIARTGCKKTKKAYDKDKHNKLAYKIAAESMVLLKNDNGLLPLNVDANIAFIGEFAEKPRFQGAGSSQVNPTSVTSVLETAKKYADVSYCRGYVINDCDEPNVALQAGAVEVAKTVDLCVLFVGLPPVFESEGYDRTHMKLPNGQTELIEAVCAVNKNVVIVMHNGSPVEMPWIDNVSGVLEAYLGGQASGGAISDILFGIVNPSGKLAESFPKKLGHNPSHLYYFGERDVTEYREGIFVGYRYYDTKELDVLFPFGHGLSYTTFKYSDLKLSKESMDDGETLKVSVDVTNVGDVTGKEVVQLYVGARDKDDRIIRASKELKEFAKVMLKPREKKTVTFKLDKSAFAYYNTDINDWHVLTGVYKIMIGSSSRNIALTKEVTVNSAVELLIKANINTTVRDIVRMERGPQFLGEMKELIPTFAKTDKEAEPGSLDSMAKHGIQEMVLRQVRLMGEIPGKSAEDIKKLIDEKLN